MACLVRSFGGGNQQFAGHATDAGAGDAMPSVNSPLPSDMKSMFSACCGACHVCITNGSFTARQMRQSMPFALNTPASSLKRGKCMLEQVGLKATGSANSTTVLPLNKVLLSTFCHAPSPRIGNVTYRTL